MSQSDAVPTDHGERFLIMPPQNIPLNCYRLQFNGDFTFLKATEILDYLDRLGITTIYASPILQSRTGSEHGYDVTDPTRISTDLGGEQQFETFHAELARRGMGLLLDIVPNHMAASPENPWWMDVLENGPGSIYGAYFDIDWHPPSRIFENKILLPVLGSFYAEVLRKQELRLAFSRGSFLIHYYDSAFPIAPKSYRDILAHRQQLLEHKLGSKSPQFQEYLGILTGLDALAPRQTLPVYATGERRLQVAALKERLKELHDNDKTFRNFLDGNVEYFNGKAQHDSSFSAMDHLLSQQSYALAYWNSANAEINYRRFFNVAELIGVRVEDPAVVEATHSTIFRLIEKGSVTGLRIDHIDGLRDPLGYLQRVQNHVGEQTTSKKPSKPLYIVVEKILSGGEQLPEEWPVSGTTGYEFLNAVNRIFVHPQGVRDLEKTYFKLIGWQHSFPDLLYEKKKLIMTSLLGVEMRYLGHQLAILAQQDRFAREIPGPELTQAFFETTACLAVYRTFVRGMDVSNQTKYYIGNAITEAQSRNLQLGKNCFSFVADVLLGNESDEILPEQREARHAFVMRWQQLTGAIVAKGFEDTLLYVYFPLLSLNDVGGDPRPTPSPAIKFEDFISERFRRWPYGLNSTATHDTKRGEDMRARINVLSEIPDEWSGRLSKWLKLNFAHRKVIGGQTVPDANEEIFLYQTLIGAWPLDPEEISAFGKRFEEYLVKANREAKVHTRWTRPNLEHEKALQKFARAIIQEGKRNLFLKDFLTFYKKISYFGMINGLGQTLIKVTSPGVPEIYQGCELWDFRLVDPDNRRPVDYSVRAKYLLAQEKRSRSPEDSFRLAAELTESWDDGGIKLYLTWKALNLRKEKAALFLDGAFHMLKVSGRRAANVIAYARHHKKDWIVVVVPRWLAHEKAPVKQRDMQAFWGETRIVLPERAPKRFRNIFTADILQVGHPGPRSSLRVSDLLKVFPVACLSSEVASGSDN
jgi:(1->4)-alpha-D-glucan 1-alpha-D-glucosylmutase